MATSFMKNIPEPRKKETNPIQPLPEPPTKKLSAAPIQTNQKEEKKIQVSTPKKKKTRGPGKSRFGVAVGDVRQGMVTLTPKQCEKINEINDKARTKADPEKYKNISNSDIFRAMIKTCQKHKLWSEVEQSMLDMNEKPQDL